MQEDPLAKLEKDAAELKLTYLIPDLSDVGFGELGGVGRPGRRHGLDEPRNTSTSLLNAKIRGKFLSFGKQTWVGTLIPDISICGRVTTVPRVIKTRSVLLIFRVSWGLVVGETRWHRR